MPVVFRPPQAVVVFVFATAMAVAVALQQVPGSARNLAPAAAVSPTPIALPLAFEANRGQTDSHVRFLARGSGYSLFLTQSGVSLSLRGERPAPVSLRLAGADRSAAIVGARKLPGTTNYVVGPDRGSWKTGIPTYGAVHYRGVYPGIDAVFYGKGRQLEYDFVVAPGADPSRIALELRGAETLRLNARGELVARTAAGPLVQRRPVLYQEIDGARRIVDGGYVLDGNRVRFRVGSYDRTKPLVIDPVLVYSTFVGGSGYDKVHGVAVDGAGNAYLAGITSSSDFPAATARPVSGVYDAFVAKVDPTGSTLLWLTVLGGSADERAHDVALGGDGNVYAMGRTDSVDLATLNAAQPTSGGGVDAFTAKLDAAGLPAWMTYLGGSGSELDHDYDFLAEFPGEVAVDALGNAYVAGRTDSTNFPTLNPVQSANRGYDDVFVTKLGSAGALVYSTYLGGSDNDGETNVAVAVDRDGSAYVGGSALSVDYPATARFGPGGGYGDAFVTKLSPSGSAVAYSARFGGTGTDDAADVAVDAFGHAYVAGTTASFDFPTTAGAAARSSDREAFATKLGTAGTELVYSTYVGGLGGDAAHAVAVDASGRATIAGSSASAPTFGCKWANADAFWARLDGSGTAQDSSGCLGGSTTDVVYAVAVSGDRIYMAGYTASVPPYYTPFPTTAGAYKTTGVGNEGFLAAFTDDPNATPPPPPPPPPSADVSVAVADSPDPIKSGRKAQLTYTITVSNGGPDSASSVRLSDSLPAEVSWVSTTTTQGTCSGTSAISCDLGTLASGATATVTIVVRPLITNGEVWNTASASSSTADPNTTNNSATATTSVVKRLR